MGAGPCNHAWSCSSLLLLQFGTAWQPQLQETQSLLAWNVSFQISQLWCNTKCDYMQFRHTCVHQQLLVPWKILFCKSAMILPHHYIFLTKISVTKSLGDRSWRFNTRTKACHKTQYWASSMQVPSPQPTSFRSILICSSHLLPGLQTCYFPRCFKMMYAFFVNIEPIIDSKILLA